MENNDTTVGIDNGLGSLGVPPLIVAAGVGTAAALAAWYYGINERRSQVGLVEKNIAYCTEIAELCMRYLDAIGFLPDEYVGPDAVRSEYYVVNSDRFSVPEAELVVQDMQGLLGVPWQDFSIRGRNHQLLYDVTKRMDAHAIMTLGIILNTSHSTDGRAIDTDRWVKAFGDEWKDITKRNFFGNKSVWEWMDKEIDKAITAVTGKVVEYAKEVAEAVVDTTVASAKDGAKAVVDALEEAGDNPYVKISMWVVAGVALLGVVMMKRK